MKKTVSGFVAAAVAVVVASTASAQSTNEYQYQVPSFQGQQTIVPAQQGTTVYGQQSGTVTYGTAPATGTTTYQAPQTSGTVYQGFPSAQPQPQPYFPPTGVPQGGFPQQGFPQQGFPQQGFPTTLFPGQDLAPANPAPAPRRGEVPDTDAWTFSVARYYPAIKACLRNAKVENPVIANIQERENRTIMLIGEGGTSEYSVCRTGLDGTRVRPGKEERGLPPAFYAPIGSTFTITPDRPFQPVVGTNQRLLGWIVRTQPVRLDVYGGGRTFDGQFIRPVTVNPNAQ